MPEVAVASKLSGENVQVGLGEGLMTAPWQVETMRRRVNKLISLHHEGCLVSTESPEMNSIA